MDLKKLVAGAISGALGGLIVDINSYQAWAKAHDGSTFDWTVALSRVLQGAIVGAAAAGGLAVAL
jgi:hypothetical protein